MTKKRTQLESTPGSNGGKSPRGKRKPREYRFESVDSEGKVSTLPLVLTHKDSAKQVMIFLNERSSELAEYGSFRYTELIIHQ